MCRDNKQNESSIPAFTSWYYDGSTSLIKEGTVQGLISVLPLFEISVKVSRCILGTVMFC